MIPSGDHDLWFVTGSQHLYGDDTLDLVATNADAIAGWLDDNAGLALPLVRKPVMTTPDELARLVGEANADPRCAGLVLWMHTFSPARMWISFLGDLAVPWVHLHTQFSRDLPWADIDMDYMNAHQSAHGDREFGHMASRMRIRRKVVAGHWEDPDVGARLATWSRAAFARADARGARLGRLGDNMREVAVTEGDKVEFQRVFGYEVNGYGIGELSGRVAELSDGEVTTLCEAYADEYDMASELLPDGDRHGSLRDAAAIELGLRQWLADEELVGFTDTFQDLYGVAQLPGIAAQRLMVDGYGFGAEGDWKTAALVRATKVMAHGRPGGSSFMEDYTYHLDPSGSFVLGAHMLEVCPTIAAGRPRCEVHPLSIGDREDPVRLVFDAQPGVAVNFSVIDLGDRFRMTACVVDVVEAPEPMPNLPVARTLWQPRPDLATSAEGWILAGGSHHSSHSTAIGPEEVADLARMVGVELVTIDGDTDLADLEHELRWNDAAFRLGLG